MAEASGVPALQIKLNSETSISSHVSSEAFSNACKSYFSNHVTVAIFYSSHSQKHFCFECKIRDSIVSSSWFLEAMSSNLSYHLHKKYDYDIADIPPLIRNKSSMKLEFPSAIELKQLKNEIERFNRELSKIAVFFLACSRGGINDPQKINKHSELLVNYKNYKDHKGMTPLMLACYHNSTHLIKALLQNNPDLRVLSESHYPKTALHYCCHSNSTEALAIMLKAEGIEQLPSGNKIFDITTYAALVAPTTRHLELLINDDRFDINGKVTEFNPGQTPLMKSLCFFQPQLKLEKLRLLINKGANLDLQNRLGNTAFHHAVAYGQVECMQALLSAGASVTLRNNNNQTPFKCHGIKMETDNIITKRIPSKSQCLVEALKNEYIQLATEMIKAGWEIDVLPLSLFRKSDSRKKFNSIKNTLLQVSTLALKDSIIFTLLKKGDVKQAEVFLPYCLHLWHRLVSDNEKGGTFCLPPKSKQFLSQKANEINTAWKTYIENEIERDCFVIFDEDDATEVNTPSEEVNTSYKEELKSQQAIELINDTNTEVNNQKSTSNIEMKDMNFNDHL